MAQRPIATSARFLCIPLVLAASMGAGVVLAQAMGHGSDAMQKSMMSGMDGMKDMKMSGDTDKDFAMMMKMHHQQALGMAKVEVEQGKSPELKAMASKMIKDQSKEIEQLDQWMKKQK